MTARMLCIATTLLLVFHTPNFADTFFDPGLGARALGVGSAYTAIADDATAAYWNPARLTFLRQHIYLNTGLTLGAGGPGRFPFAAAAAPLGPLMLGFWWANQDAGGGARHAGMGVALGARLGPGRAGLGLKRLSLDDGTTHADGVGWDLSLMGDFLDMVSVGILVQDLGRTQLKAGQALVTTVAPTLQLGGSFRVESFTLSAETVLRDGTLEALRFGAEVRLAGIVAFRVGKDDDRWSWGAGLGLLGRYQLDVAHRLDPDQGDLWMFTMLATF